MIKRNPAIPDNIFELKRQESFGDYARLYKDEIAQRYEQLNIIYIPYFPLKFDLAFFQTLTFPPELAKVGTKNGISNEVFVRDGNNLKVDSTHILVRVAQNQPVLANYLRNQISSVNAQVEMGLRILFPRYYSLKEFNTTWRLTETRDQVMHIDGFQDGRPLSAAQKNSHRIKIFINIDSEPRRWRTSYTLPELFNRCRQKLPAYLPNDADQIAHILGKTDVFEEAPYHEIEFPTLSAVLVEAQVVGHSVLYGRRMIAGEYSCSASDMLDPTRNVHAALPHWLQLSGLNINS
jgi:hypothetical protein